MRGLAQALLLAPVLVGAAPSRIEDKAKDASPSTFVTFDIPPGFDEDQPKPYTLHLQVLEAPTPCAYPNIVVNSVPLTNGGHTLGRGTFAGDNDATTFIASWSSTCAGDEQLLRFTLESLAGRTLASDLEFVARFRQTSPAAMVEVAGPVRVSDSRPGPPPTIPDGREPRPGDDEDGLLEDPPFPPPPHHHVGNHREGDHPRPPPPPPPPPPHHHDDEKIDHELRELDCLHHQLHALKHLIREKEHRLEREHGVVVPHRGHRGGGPGLRDCDSLKCVLDTLMHSVGGGFRGGFHGFGRHRHGPPGHHHGGPRGGPPPVCGAFPFPGHGNHTHGNHTLPPPPPGFCHCGPPPPEGPPPPPFDEPPHGPPPPFEEPPHHGPPHGPLEGHHGPPPPPPGPPPPDHEHEFPMTSDHHRPHPHHHHHHGPPPPPPPHVVPLLLKLSFVLILLASLVLAIRSRRTSRRSTDRQRRRRRRRDAREARRVAFTASLADVWSRVFAARSDLSSATFDDEEKRAFLSGGHHRSPSDASDQEAHCENSGSMAREIVEFRNAATVVTEIVAAEEGRQRRQQQMLAAQRRQKVTVLAVPAGVHEMPQPHSPTAAFAEYMAPAGDDELPTYDEAAPSSVVDGFSSHVLGGSEAPVSDGFSSYTPGSSECASVAPSDGPVVDVEDVPGERDSKR